MRENDKRILLNCSIGILFILIQIAVNFYYNGISMISTIFLGFLVGLLLNTESIDKKFFYSTLLAIILSLVNIVMLSSQKNLNLFVVSLMGSLGATLLGTLIQTIIYAKLRDNISEHYIYSDTLLGLVLVIILLYSSIKLEITPLWVLILIFAIEYKQENLGRKSVFILLLSMIFSVLALFIPIGVNSNQLIALTLIEIFFIMLASSFIGIIFRRAFIEKIAQKKNMDSYESILSDTKHRHRKKKSE